MRIVAYWFLILLPLYGAAQSEADYARGMAAALGGKLEVPVTGGRVDILTETHAIEVDWASKWKESIGQALWYGLQTNRRAGIILILKTPSDYKYFVQLNSALQHGGLSDQIQTWVYPNDFPGVEPTGRERPNFAEPTSTGTTTNYWLSTNSNKRHLRGCRWYENSRGRYCTGEEGELAGCCH